MRESAYHGKATITERECQSRSTLGFVFDGNLARIEVNKNVDRVGTAADLTIFDKNLIFPCGNVHIDLVDFEAPGTTKNLSHGTLGILAVCRKLVPTAGIVKPKSRADYSFRLFSYSFA
jgi:hypothetical protein